jgi:quercetin 2,3-dioxygenase
MEIIRSGDRGYFNHGWLKTHHTFSFADYYNAQRMRFGAIRVLNDDIVEANQGFGTHSHQNMEIISIPLYGALEHKDSTGISRIITSQEVQVMSAGTGVYHSEMNPLDEAANFLQIWIFPDKKNVNPRYKQKSFQANNRKEKLQLLVSPDSRDESLWIHQQAFISRINISRNTEFKYPRYVNQKEILTFIIDGRIQINGLELEKRDTILSDKSESIKIAALSNEVDILFIEIPMTA